MWVAKQHYDVLGTRFEVRIDDHEIVSRVSELLAPFRSFDDRPVRPRNLFLLANSRPGDDRHHAYRDCQSIARSDSWALILDQMMGAINRRAIADMEYFGVHAGVVSSLAGAVALPGASGAGKSTLVAACLRAGFDYISDEALCLDYYTGSVVPYPKPLSLSPWSIDALEVEPSELGFAGDSPKATIRPQTVGGRIVTAPSALSDVVFFNRRPGPPNIEASTPSSIVAGLLRFSFNHHKRPADAFGLTTDLARRCQSWTLGYDDPREAAVLLRSILLG